MADIHTQIAANQVGDDSLLRYLQDFELDDLSRLEAEVLTRSEQGMREAIAALPDGRYEKTIHTDGLDEPVTIACAVEIQGDEIGIDFAGSSPQANSLCSPIASASRPRATTAPSRSQGGIHRIGERQARPQAQPGA